MNKVELINAVAAKAGMTKVDARKAIDAMMDVTKAELKKDGKIALPDGFIHLTHVQQAGKKAMPITDFLRGTQLVGAWKTAVE